MYDVIVIGSGIAGAAAARVLAEEQGKRVLVMEKRPHIGGNCYDVEDELWNFDSSIWSSYFSHQR